MKTHLLIAVSAFAFTVTLAARPAVAQSVPAAEIAPELAVDVTPFVALGDPLSSRVGAAVTFPWTASISLEAEVGYRRSEMNALSASANVLYDLPRLGRVTPYLAAGAGLEQYGTALQMPGGGLVTQPHTALVVNAGGGLKVPVDRNWGLRTDARWFNGIGGQAPEHWRVYNGVTLRPGKR